VHTMMHAIVVVLPMMWLLKMIVYIAEVMQWMHRHVVVQALMHALVLVLATVWMPKVYTARIAVVQ